MLVGDLNLVFGPLNNKKGSYVYDPYWYFVDKMIVDSDL
jgi:hypothetical protein